MHKQVKVETHHTKIQSIDFLSSEVVKLVVKSNHHHKFHFLPGQYAKIEIPGTSESRSYSFSSAAETDTVEFLIRLLPQGLMSDFLRGDAKIGTPLNMMEPYGSFYLREITKPTLFFAGGTGIAPFLAFLEKLSGQKNVPHPIQLFYGATTDENLVELERLKKFTKTLPFTFFTCVSIEASQIHPRGFVTQWITKENLSESGYDIYVCGPPPMVDAVKVALEKENIEQNHFYVEKFSPTNG